MPAEYNTSELEGSSYVRARKVIIDYTLNATPKATFIREKVLTLGSDIIKQPVSSVSFDYNASGSIALRNPETGELTGETTTQAAVFQAMYSLFYALSVEADT